MLPLTEDHAGGSLEVVAHCKRIRLYIVSSKAVADLCCIALYRRTVPHMLSSGIDSDINSLTEGINLAFTKRQREQQ